MYNRKQPPNGGCFLYILAITYSINFDDPPLGPT